MVAHAHSAEKRNDILRACGVDPSSVFGDLLTETGSSESDRQYDLEEESGEYKEKSDLSQYKQK